MPEWSKIIENRKEYFILKRVNSINEYALVRKPLNQVGTGQFLEYFSAESDLGAADKGVKIAKKFGLFP